MMNVEGGYRIHQNSRFNYLIFKLMEDSFRFDEIEQIVELLLINCHTVCYFDKISYEKTHDRRTYSFCCY
jgi:hypothetical protein